MRLTPIVCLLATAFACTEPSRPAPVVGTFVLDGRFAGRVQRSFACSSSGCIMKHDTTVIDGPANGTVTFDSLAESANPASVTLSLGQCEYCLVNAISIGHAFREGDSVKVFFGVSPSLQLLGIYRRDSIAGRIEATESGSVNNTYWGTFVARKSP